jgi:hypothetical protein
MNKKKVASLALAAAILASSGGAVGSVITAAPAEAATLTTSAPANLKAFTDASTLQSGITFTRPTTIVGTITNYTVILKQAGKADRVSTNVSGRVLFGAPLAGLAENTAYTVQVKANVVSSRGVKSTGAVASTSFKTGYSKSTVKPTAPGNLKITDVAEKSFVARWTAPVGYVGTVTGYTVSLKKSGVLVKTVSVSPSTLSYKADGLLSATAYTTEVTANFASPNKMAKASSVAAKVVAATAKPAAVSLNPVVDISGISSNSATLNWKPIPGATTYLTFISEKGGQLVSRGEYGTTTTNAPVPNVLKPGTTYIADVQAVIWSSDGKTWKAYSGTKEFTTTAPAPGLNPVVKVSNITSNSAQVSWTKSTAPNLNMYMVTFAEKGSQARPMSARYGTNTLSIGSGESLKPNTTYYVNVQAWMPIPDKDGVYAYVGSAEFTTKG